MICKSCNGRKKVLKEHKVRGHNLASVYETECPECRSGNVPEANFNAVLADVRATLQDMKGLYGYECENKINLLLKKISEHIS